MIQLQPRKLSLACLLCQRPLSREAINAMRRDPRLLALCSLCSVHNPLCPERRLLGCQSCSEVRFTLKQLEEQK